MVYKILICMMLMSLIPYKVIGQKYDINPVDASLLWSVFHCKVYVLESSLDNGGNPNSESLGRSLLRVAIDGERCQTEEDKKEIIRLLLEFGANPNAVAIPTSQETPLMVAADRSDNVSIIESIFQAGGGETLNKTDTYGNTALMLAVLKGHGETVCFLLSVGARVDISNIVGWTAFEYALINQSSIASAISNHNPQASSELTLARCRLNIAAAPLLGIQDPADVIEEEILKQLQTIQETARQPRLNSRK